MSNKNHIQILVEQLAIQDDILLGFFKTKGLDRVVVDEFHNTWTFYFTSRELINSSYYKLLENSMKAGFPYDVEIFFVLHEALEITPQYVIMTFESLLREDYIDSDFLINALEFTQIHYQNNKLYISCGDSYHKDRFDEKKDELTKHLQHLGLNIELVTSLNEKVVEEFEDAIRSKQQEDDRVSAIHAQEVT